MIKIEKSNSTIDLYPKILLAFNGSHNFIHKYENYDNKY